MQISKMGSNEAGAWAIYTDGTEFRYLAWQDKTYITRPDGTTDVAKGRIYC